MFLLDAGIPIELRLLPRRRCLVGELAALGLSRRDLLLYCIAAMGASAPETAAVALLWSIHAGTNKEEMGAQG
jgi:hypothetical protein